jgi:hypothetical protein
MRSLNEARAAKAALKKAQRSLERQMGELARQMIAVDVEIRSMCPHDNVRIVHNEYHDAGRMRYPIRIEERVCEDCGKQWRR